MTVNTDGARDGGRGMVDANNHRGNSEDGNHPPTVDGGGAAAWLGFLDRLEKITQDTIAALRKLDPPKTKFHLDVSVAATWAVVPEKKGTHSLHIDHFPGQPCNGMCHG